jgi:ubiquinone/menaquinone biosynthesis C-methylase UbiE
VTDRGGWAGRQQDDANICAALHPTVTAGRVSTVPIVLNLGGEGEVAGAIDLNSLESTRRRPRSFVAAGSFIQGDFRRLPIRDGAVDEVIASHIPLRIPDGDDVTVAREAFRVLKPGGTTRMAPTFPAEGLTSALKLAGFMDVRINQGFACGEKRDD